MSSHQPPSRRRHREVDAALPLSFTADADEPDRDALASLASGRHDPAATTPDGRSDQDWLAEAAGVVDPDSTREFWGDGPGWRRSGEIERMGRRRTRTTSSTSRKSRTPLRRSAPASATTGSIQRTRTHRVVDAGSPEPSGRAPAEAEGPPEARPERVGLGAIDPLLRRLGAIVMVGVLLVPVVLALRSSSGEGSVGLRTLASGEMADVLPLGALGRSVSGSGSPAATPPPVDATAADDLADDVAADDVAVDDVALDEVPVDPVAVSCGLDYTVVAGDYWLRLAEESGADLADVLGVNAATIETPLYPGDEICLPAGASRPAPPTTVPVTTAPATTAPATTAAVSADSSASSNSGSGVGSSPEASSSASSSSGTTASTAPPATTVPATTVPATTVPATTAPPPVSNASPEQVRQMIREVFPEDQHEMAINVARRESSLRANAYNGWCCHGIFQIHWQAHRSWLQGQGITSSNQLYDARTNIELAYQIYLRAGGWGPWSQTAY